MSMSMISAHESFCLGFPLMYLLFSFTCGGWFLFEVLFQYLCTDKFLSMIAEKQNPWETVSGDAFYWNSIYVQASRDVQPASNCC